MKIFSKIIIMLSLLMPISLFGKQSYHTYFIAPTGNDITGDGTKAKPWFTLNKAWASTNAGDVIYLRGGTYYYDAGQLLSDKNGAPESFIKVWAYENEKPLIRPGAAYTGKVGITVKGVNYVHLKGIEICYYEQRTPDQWYSGITAADVNYCIFELLNIHNNGFGMSVARSRAGNPVTENLFLNCDFHHNYDPITSIGTNFPYGGSDGLTIRVDNPNSVNTVKGCRMWNNSDDGFDGWTNAGMLIFDGCWSFNNGFREDGISKGGDGNGFKFGPMVGPPWTGYENQHKRTFVNCVAFCNRAIGFDQNRTYCIKHLYNNIAYKNGYYGFTMNQ